MLLILRALTDIPLVVNFDHVDCVESSDKPPDSTVIHFTSGKHVHVKEEFVTMTKQWMRAMGQSNEKA